MDNDSKNALISAALGVVVALNVWLATKLRELEVWRAVTNLSLFGDDNKAVIGMMQRLAHLESWKRNANKQIAELLDK